MVSLNAIKSKRFLRITFSYIIVLLIPIFIGIYKHKVSSFEFGIALFSGSCLALIFAYANIRPAILITKSLSGSEFTKINAHKSPTAKDPYSLIELGISELSSKHMTLQEDLLGQKDYLSRTLIRDLLAGQSYPENELHSMIEYLQLPLKGSLFCLAAVKICIDEDYYTTNVNDISACEAIIRETLTRVIGSKLILHNTGKGSAVLIFNLSAIELEQEFFEEFITDAINGANAILNETHSIEIFAGFSGYCFNVSSFWMILSQAEQALQCADNDDNVVFYSHLKPQEQSYYYPKEIEQWLIHSAQIGDYNKIELNLDVLYRENILQRNLSTQERNSLLLAMYSTIDKLLVDSDSYNRIFASIIGLKQNRRASDNINQLKSIYKKICRLRVDESASPKQQFVAKATEYIEENYMDSALSLNSLASHFELSEGYFSLFFKENAGVNFTEFLQKFRLTKSLELLNTTDLTIDAIAAKVGYNSGQSYRRAFKKVYSCSPTQMKGQPDENA